MLIEQLLLKQEEAGGATVAVLSYDDGDLGIKTIDISDPSSMSVLDTLVDAGEAFDTGTPLPFEDVAVDSVNQVAYASLGSQTIISYDISDPSSISELDNLDAGGGSGAGLALDVAGGLAYMTAYDNDSISKINISTPSAMVDLGEEKTTNLRDATDVVLDVANNYAYVSLYGGNGVASVNTSTMTFVDSVTSTADLEDSAALSIDLTTDHVYVASYLDDCITSVDISNPASLSIAGTLSNSNLDRATDIDIDVDNQVAYVVSENGDSFCTISSIDISTPTSMSQLDTLNLESAASSTPKIKIDTLKQVAYVFYTNGTNIILKSVDISTPSSMTVLDTLTVVSGATLVGGIDLYFPQ